jgi:hypothetical protein
MFKSSYNKAYNAFTFETLKETFIFNAQSTYKKPTLSFDQLYKLKNSNSHLIIFDDYEPTNFYHFKQKFPKLLDDIPPQNVVIVSSNLFYVLNPHSLKKDHCPYKIFYFNDYFKFMIYRHAPDDRSFEVKKHYTCLSGVDKYFRRYFFYLLKTNDLLPYGFVSHNRVKNSTDDGDTYFDNKIKDLIPAFDAYNYISKEKLFLDASNSNRSNFEERFKLVMNADFSKNSGIEVILETSIKGCNFVSEKTIKAILNKNIFLLVGGCQTLVFLRKLGFKTFDHIFDESYDNIRCDFTRVNSVFAQLKKFSTLSLDEVKKIKNDNQELLDYNYNHLLYNLDTTFNLKNKVESYLNKGENYGRN